jgi:hypothetical protein
LVLTADNLKIVALLAFRAVFEELTQACSPAVLLLYRTPLTRQRVIVADSHGSYIAFVTSRLLRANRDALACFGRTFRDRRCLGEGRDRTLYRVSIELWFKAEIPYPVSSAARSFVHTLYGVLTSAFREVHNH